MHEKEIETTETETETEENKFRLRNVVSDQDAMFLREKSEPVAFAVADNSGNVCLDKDTTELIQALKDYVIENDGLGMAAIQVGVKKRVFVMRKPYNTDNLIVVINPKILRGDGKAIGIENCFSIDLPAAVKGARVQRQTRIYVNYIDEDGVDYKDELFVGMDARVFQHEYDHLFGWLMLDDKTPTGKFKGWMRAH
jgi:peptide deformylase